MAGATRSSSPACSTRPQTITLTGGQLELSGTTGTTTITGPGANLLSVSGNKASRVFLVDQGVTASVSGLTITGGNTAYEGGGLENAGELMLTDCTVSGNSAAAGGGLFNTGGGTTTLTHCTFSGNSAVTSGGGLLNYGSTLSLTDCTFSGNSAGVGGGLVNYIHYGGALSLTDCTVSGNTATFRRRRPVCHRRRRRHDHADRLHGQRQHRRERRRPVRQRRHDHADRLHRRRQHRDQRPRRRPV